MAGHTDEQFGSALLPALIRACDDRLSQVNWFRTSWQRGGALTGYGQYRNDSGQDEPVVVKMPVPPQERQWLDHLQPHRHEAGEVVPRLYASDTSLNGYDLAWVVMERLPHGPIDSTWQGAEVPLLVEAAGRFYAATHHTPPDDPPRQENWPDIIKRARRTARDHEIDEPKRWIAALKAFSKKQDKLLAKWDARPTNQWCHGDLHLANAMTRLAPPDGPALLFDLAGVHAGHWTEDAVYFEHLFWAAPHRIGDHNVAKLIAQRRKEHSLPGESDWPDLANIRRALLAASAPAYMRAEGDPRHTAAALGVLENSMKLVS